MVTKFGHFRKLPPPSIGGLDKLGLGILLYAYAVLLGAAYLFAFWRTIGFDIFPYLSLQDYISAPFNRVIVLVAIPLLFALLNFGRKGMSDVGASRDVFVHLFVLYSLAFAVQQYEAISRYLQHDFSFKNERTVLIYATALFLVSLGLSYRIYRSSQKFHLQVFAFILLQTAVSMSAGYSDGKVIYNGAANVYFLDNKELCETGGAQAWVYLGKFTEHVFFMNAIDKRLCVSGEKNFKLISRKFKEGL